MSLKMVMMLIMVLMTMLRTEDDDAKKKKRKKKKNKTTILRIRDCHTEDASSSDGALINLRPPLSRVGPY
jgi:hypothetical protein